MAKLNCRVGDLAMIVRYELPADLGVIVRILGVSDEMQTWWGSDDEIHIWNVEVISKGNYYCYPHVDEELQKIMNFNGPMPDAYLMPITPPPEIIEQIALELQEEAKQESKEQEN
jgi:hypothetical protein